MNIQAISYAQRPAFKGIEQANDKDKKNVFINGGAGEIGNTAACQDFISKHTPEGYSKRNDALREYYKNQNIVLINLGSCGTDPKKGITEMKKDAILNIFKHNSAQGDMPDCVQLDVDRKNEGTPDERVYLKVSSKFAPEETIRLVATRDLKEVEKAAKEETKEGGFTIDIAKDCTGSKDALTREGLEKVKEAVGAKVAILSAPSKEKKGSTAEPIPMIVPGVNAHSNKVLSDAVKNHGVFSAASCTTTCVSPVAQVLEDTFGIDVAYLHTVHAVTATQPTEDRTKKEADSKNRSCMQLVPTKTGAAVAASKVIPSLTKKVKNEKTGEEETVAVMDGKATRSPVIDGSLIVYTAYTTDKNATKESVEKALKDACENEYKGIMAFADKGSASNDVIGRPENALIIPESIVVTEGKSGNKMITVQAYYDNVYGYTTSMSGRGGHMVAEQLLEQDKARA